MSKAAASGKWTPEQAEAIGARGGNLLVSAAAGAGKTAVLVERILSRIKDEENPVDIDHLLVVTFTNAAAAEMRERIASAISEEMAGRVDGGGRMGVQLALLNRARITTIHSFCTDVLRQYFYRIDLDPGFRIADQTESALLKADVLDQLLEEKYSDGEDTGFKALADCYGGDLDDGGLMQMIIRVYDFSRSNPDPAGWLERMAGRFQPRGDARLALGLVAREALNEALRTLEGALSDLGGALAMCQAPGGPENYASFIKNDIAGVRDLIALCRAGWDEAHRAVGEMEFAALKKAGAGVDEVLKAGVMEARNRAKRKVKGLAGGLLSRSLDEHALDLEKVAPVMGALADLVSRFDASYRQAKVSRCLVDFGDLEHYCLQILADRGPAGEIKPSAVALELREQFEEVLVDEYQDINPVQEAIIKLVARPAGPAANLFMVGDVKQSIYRFRLADPTLFLQKYREYSARGGSGRLINLSRNFRSRREVIDAVNWTFRRIMTAEAAEMDYDRQAELVCGAGWYSGEGGGLRVDLHIMDRSRAGRDEDGPGESGRDGESVDPPDEAFAGEEEPGAVEAEARLAARLIRDLADSGLTVYDREAGGPRPVSYRDMVILMRATRGRAGTYLDEMKALGIPAYSEPDGGYFRSAEIETMVSLLKLVDNPRQDIPLAAVLRSPVVGLGSRDLAMVRMAGRSGDLWEAVTCAARSAGGGLAERLSVFIRSLERWRELARRATMSDLIWTIYRETGYYNYSGSMPGGAQRQANLRALHHWAGQYEATTFRGIFTFLRFIDRMRERGEDPGRARTLGEKENVVRIMSIHKSKGLEFPVVLVAGLGKKFNLQDLGSDMLLHRELGFGPVLVDQEVRVSYPTLALMAVRERLRRELLAEEMRILYVAMTRAREKLILTGSVENLRRSATFWTRDLGREIPASDILGARSYLDWICPALARHPDGRPLREAAGAPEPGAAGEEGPLWSVSVCYPAVSPEGPSGACAAAVKEDVAELIRRGEKVDMGGEKTGEVDRRLSWVYPDREAAGKPAKISVTGLGADRAEARTPPEADQGVDYGADPGVGGGQDLPFLRPAYARPAFMTARRDLTASEKGSAVHVVMRHLDLGGRLDARGVWEQVEAMRERDLLTAEQASAVDCGKVAEFFRSGLGRRVLASRQVKRELPFSLAVPAERIYPGLSGCPGERVIVQGVIDCLVEEEDGYLLIDYKTDRSGGQDPAGLAEKYRGQLDWYAGAVETLTGRRVKERCLYLFDPGIVVTV